MKLNDVVSFAPAVDTIVWAAKNRTVKSQVEINHDLVGDWKFHDEFHNYETLIRNMPFDQAADVATKSYCQQCGTKFARLYV